MFGSRNKSREAAVSSAPRGVHRQRSLIFWKLEIASAIVALVALGVIIWELTKIDGTLLTDWHYRVSPNAFLSIFITIAKTGTAICLGSAFAQLCWIFYLSNSQKLTHIDNFASAREGPFGSFLLLFKLELWGMVPTVARFGALTALLALAMDPFAQQILSFDPREIVVPENATAVQRTNSYTAGISVLSNNGFQQALFGALLGINIPMQYTCATGNCTYPDFVSLGICSRCEDVNREVFPSCNATNFNISRGCPSLNYNIPSFNLSVALQNGSIDGNDTSKYVDNSEKPSGIFTLVKTTVSDTRPYGLENTTLFSFTIAQLRIDSSEPALVLHTPPAWNVSACGIRWCGKLYQNLSVVNGDLENITPTEFDLVPNPTSACFTNGTCQEFIPSNPSALPGAFNTTKFQASAVSFTVKDLLNIDSRVFVTNGILPASAAGSIANAILWGIEIDTGMKRVAKTMTDFIRAFVNPQQIHGAAHQLRVYIQVHWGWFTLPCVVTAFSIVFMLIVMRMTSAKKSVMWKASSVPLVMTGLRDTHADVSQTEYQKGPNVEAMEVRVQLTRDDDGHFTFRRTGALLDDTDAR